MGIVIYRQDGVSWYLNLLTGRKSAFSPHRGDSLHRFTWNLAHGSAWPCKISRQSVPGVGNAVSKLQKFPLFGKESPHRGRTLSLVSSFNNFVRGFYTPNYPALVFHTWRDSLHRLRSYCCETARRSFTPNFSVHPVGKTMRWIDKWLTPFNGLDVFYHHAQFGGDRTTRARCENMVFVCFWFSICFSRSEAGALFVRGGILWTGIVSQFMGRFWFCFHLFQKWCARQFLFLLLIFAKLRSKIAKSPIIGGKVCAPHFV